MPMEREKFWEDWGGWIKASGWLVSSLVVGFGAYHATTPAPDSPQAYDLRVRTTQSEIDALKRQLEELQPRVRTNSENIASMKADIEAFKRLADERLRSIMAIEAEQRRLSEGEYAILERLRAVERTKPR